MQTVYPKTKFLASYFHTPSELARTAFIHVLRGGHLKSSPDYKVERRFCLGHDLIYCLSGRGHVQIEGKSFTISSSELLWIDGRYPHVHWAEPHLPWEVLWIRADGGALTRSAEALHINREPVFSVAAGVADTFRSVHANLETQPLALDALLHRDVSAILCSLFEGRHSLDEQLSLETNGVSPELKLVIETMGIYFYRKWTVPQLAKLARMTESQFYRSFHKATGSSPISWMRRQRVSLAKRRLVESRDSIKEIAEQVGYSDAFYFSRDFRLSCGLSPKHYREQESTYVPLHDLKT